MRLVLNPRHEVVRDALLRVPALDDAAAIEQQAVVAERCDAFELVGHDHDRQAAPDHLANPVERLPLEPVVADGEHLVDDQDVGTHVRGDREPKPRVHPARIALDRGVDELAQFRERARCRRSGSRSPAASSP